jgi:hypothetical protein
MEDNKNTEYVTIQGVLNKQFQDQKKFIEDIDREEELINNLESEDSIKNEIKAAKMDTDRKKNSFINEMKMGLGAEIKANPNGVIIREKSWWDKFKGSLNKLFTKF